MKKLFLLAICIWQFNAQAQHSIKTFDEDGNCPAGYCAGFFIEIENFNFHKPRTECTRGFGFCLRISVGATCVPCMSRVSANEKSATVIGYLNKESITLHLPKSLQENGTEKEADFANFEIEEKTFEIKYPDGQTAYLKGGTYTITEENDELIVRIPVE